MKIKKLFLSIIAFNFYLGLSSAEALAPHAGYASPDDAEHAVQKAAEAESFDALGKIFGTEFLERISSGDPVAEKYGLGRLAYMMTKEAKFVSRNDGSLVLEVGENHWPFPVPLVKNGDKWFFDTDKGAEEIINRRVGQNELSAISVCAFYVAAQKLYQAMPRTEDGVAQYAQKILSTTNKKDGLFWKVEGDNSVSPFAPVITKANQEGYNATNIPAGGPVYHGYRYKVLTEQGKDAPGGAKYYIVNGKMTGGFALLAYPARAGVSGIMSFIVGPEGKIYQKDLGDKTDASAATMKQFNPDPSWKEVKEED